MNEVKVSQKELLTLVDVKRRRAEKLGRFLRDNAFILTILLSILVGFGVGIGLKTGLNERDRNAVIPWFTLPGQLFMRALELLVVPMVFVSVTCATGSLSPRNNLRVTVISLGLVLLTHVASVLTGLAGGLILTACSSPPVKTSLITNKLYEKQKETYDIAADLLRNLIPKNIIKAATSQEVTRYYFSNVNGTVKFTRKIEYTDGANILGILSFAILLGLASSVLEERAALFRQLFKSCNDVILLALRWLIKIVPLGIASLIVQAVFEVQDVAASLAKIALFTGVCLACLVFYGGGVLALILFAFTRANPFKFYLSFVEPAMIAFCSTSEAVCIQKCMDICEEKIGIDPRLAKFSIPFYVALQKSGSAVFITISCAFLANYSGTTLSAADYVVVMIMAGVMCLCLPNMPSASIVTILVILNAVNVPSTNIAVLYTVEWLLDRVRTCVNMYGHCFSTVITYELSKNNMDECSQITSTGAFTLDEDVQLSRVHSQKQSRENTIETI